MKTTFIGLLRDFLAAGLGLAILFGANLSDEQVAGVLLLVTTGAALGTHLLERIRARGGTA